MTARTVVSGTAAFALDLVALLEGADPETTVLAVNYGTGGADALRLTTGDGVDRADGYAISELLDAKEYVTYAKHLAYREPVEYQGVTSA